MTTKDVLTIQHIKYNTIKYKKHYIRFCGKGLYNRLLLITYLLVLIYNNITSAYFERGLNGNSCGLLLCSLCV